jgi:hypothetical protein
VWCVWQDFLGGNWLCFTPPSGRATPPRHPPLWRCACGRAGTSSCRRTSSRLVERQTQGRQKALVWYGHGGTTLHQINSLVNSRPVREIGYQTPADVLAAYLADPRTDEDEKIVAEAQKVVLGIAGARHGATHITPFRVSQSKGCKYALEVKHTGLFSFNSHCGGI